MLLKLLDRSLGEIEGASCDHTMENLDKNSVKRIYALEVHRHVLQYTYLMKWHSSDLSFTTNSKNKIKTENRTGSAWNKLSSEQGLLWIRQCRVMHKASVRHFSLTQVCSRLAIGCPLDITTFLSRCWRMFRLY